MAWVKVTEPEELLEAIKEDVGKMSNLYKWVVLIMSFKIGSINMYKFSDNDTCKNIKQIAKIIQEEDFDIVALQEVFSEDAVRRLIDEFLGWEYIWKSPDSRSLQAAEGYAFMWNTKRFRLATGRKKGEYDGDKSYRRILPKIQVDYTHDEYLVDGKLIREPLYARFESVFGWYELRLINTHIIYRETQKEDNEGDKIKRKRELDILIDIYHKICNKVYENNRTSYTFLLGDYNLSLRDIDPCALNEAVKKMPDRNGRSDEIITKQHELSTLKMRSKERPDEPAQGFANNYDHFTYDADIGPKRRVDLVVERINTVSKYWKDDFELHRKEFSDHVPIKITGEFK